jgi:hypothetical protein
LLTAFSGSAQNWADVLSQYSVTVSVAALIKRLG